MAVFYGSEDNHTNKRDAVPDSAGMSESEVAELPPFVRMFKCQGNIEGGDCRGNKYTKYICPNRAKQASWHPGM